jgi:hypothetical protein
MYISGPFSRNYKNIASGSPLFPRWYGRPLISTDQKIEMKEL